MLTQIPSKKPLRIQSVPNSCNTSLGVISLPVSLDQKSSRFSRQFLLSSVIPSSNALSQSNISATASLSLSANDSFLKSYCSTNISPTVPLPPPINPHTPIIIVFPIKLFVLIHTQYHL